MVWDPRRITRRTWGEAALFYRGLEDRNADFGPLRELAEHASGQPYASALGAATSGTALLVAPAGAMEWAVEALRIDIDLGGTVQLTVPGAKTRAVEGALVPAFERAAGAAGWIEARRAGG
jgi:hypothetical protein